MARKTYSKRYAQAIFALALERGEPERWQSDLGKINRVIEDAGVKSILKTPALSLEQKMDLLAPLTASISMEAVNLIKLLIKRKGTGDFSKIYADYNELYNDYLGREKAVVTTAVPLEKAIERQIAEKLSAITGKTVEIESHVNPAILGGLVVRIGEKLIDGSTLTQLARLRRQLATVERRR